MKKILLLLVLTLISLYADTFELKGTQQADINVTSQEMRYSIKTLYKNKPINIELYNKVCLVNKNINKSIYININNSISLNSNNLCYTKVITPTIDNTITIDKLLKEIQKTKQSIKKFFTTLKFTQKDLRIKKYAEASGDDTIPLTISKNKTPIFTFEFESPNDVQLILWGENLEATKLKEHRIVVSELKIGKYGLALETNKGKKIMEFEVIVVE